MNLISISYGTFAGWPSAAFLVLSSKDTPLDSGPLSEEQLSWIGSLLGIGGLVGSILFAWLSNLVGRKLALSLVAFPAIVSKKDDFSSKNQEYRNIQSLLDRLVSGNYCEQCNESVRGTIPERHFVRRLVCAGAVVCGRDC